jgi:drug/metabolite transporter (DMT)-like permease
MSRNPLAIWGMVIAATFFWGSNFNAARALAEYELPALTAAGGRFAIAVVILLLMRALRGKPESTLGPRDMLALVILGLIGVFSFNYAFFTALHTTSALNAALIMALSPLTTTLLSAWLLKTTIQRNQIAGIAIAFIGVALVITGGHLTALRVAIGDLWMLYACLAWSVYTVLVKKYAATVPPLQQARWTIAAGALALIVLALGHESPLPLLAQQPPSVFLIMGYMAVCGTVLAYLFWLQGIQALGPQRAAITFNLVPVSALLVNLALGTLPTAEQCLGLLLVFAGVLVASGWRPQFRRAASAGKICSET